MMKLTALKIDPEFQGKIPPLNAEEEHILEQNMIQERRLLNPLIIWNGYIRDGHSRYRILKHHPEIAFEVKEIQLPDRYAALAWICQNQLGRRNLDPERRKFLMGKTYENEKLSVGGSTHREHDESGKFTSCRQNVHMRSTEKRTCERIANKNGVSSKFVQRAEKYAKGVDAAEAAVPGAMEEILTGHIKATDAEITALAQTPKEEIPAIIKELRKPKKDRKAKYLQRIQSYPEFSEKAIGTITRQDCDAVIERVLHAGKGNRFVPAEHWCPAWRTGWSYMERCEFP